MRTKKQRVFKCPNCGNKTVHQVLSITTIEEEIAIPDELHQIDSFAVMSYFFITECKTCQGVTVLLELNNANNLNGSIQLWPHTKTLGENVPKGIKESYYDAKKVKKISALAFSILMRRCLEQLCIDKGAKGRNLKQKIEWLATKDIIPKTLSNMADIIREVGNTGAHVGNFSHDEEDMDLLDDFFIAMVEYVYVAPEKLNRITQKLKKGK